VAELCDFYVDRSDKLLYNNPIENDYRALFRERLIFKHKEIKRMLMIYIKSRGLRPDIDDPNAGWATVRTIDLEA